ncbi:ABC-ATPase domain-containing protein [Pseudonocardia alni]|uniref:ABC-class ATPase n=1 Tax=Pseudonocardia alni TaxID=33907 RepID=A0A852VU39_PSEA5|nr:ABC-ATPase domain-containing protein [Pseudonocardia antarctica]NYF99866.1 putative ABC-class ATPase [Pseudonocardia antarctica]
MTPYDRPDAPRRRGDVAALGHRLQDLDGASYRSYKGLTGVWSGEDGYDLEIRTVQADPFAPPSRLRVTVPARTAGLPTGLYDGPVRARALAGFLARALRRALEGSTLRVDAGGQEVLDRSAARIRPDGTVVAELSVPLPGRGRRIDGRAAAAAVTVVLPRAVLGALRWETADTAAAQEFVETVEDAGALRDALAGRGLVGFVADGAVLPRLSGVDDRPLAGGVPFVSPPELRVTLDVPHRGTVTGMGVPEGVTLIVGGGYHGKSTLLRALESGVYDHVPGDGREFVVARADTVSVRAEDERSVQRVDVSAFVTGLPSGNPTDDFSTESASGSTSQAAATVEALEAGAGVLLIDEDTAATNAMIRDDRMRALIPAEPLVPFVERVRPLHRGHGVSTVLVMGGSGEYLDRADTVVLLQDYTASEVTGRAREIAGRADEAGDTAFPAFARREFDPRSVDASVRGRRRVTARGRGRLTFGADDIDLSAIAQLADPGQTTGVGCALAALDLRGVTLAQALDRLEEAVRREGPDAITRGAPVDVAVPRRHEVAAALNRLRPARVTHLHRNGQI